jgi:hypothetical protein
MPIKGLAMQTLVGMEWKARMSIARSLCDNFIRCFNPALFLLQVDFSVEMNLANSIDVDGEFYEKSRVPLILSDSSRPNFVDVNSIGRWCCEVKVA